MTPEEREELLAAYALGTLSGPEAAAVEQLVRGDSGAARDLARYHEIVDTIALSAPLRRADPSVRERVLRAARERVHRRNPWRYARPTVAVAAGVAAVLAMVWAIALERQLDRQARDAAAIAAVVETNAKQIQQLTAAGVTMQASEDLQVQLRNAVADQELVIAISTDPRVKTGVLDPTSAGHGATARYLWSQEAGAGVLVARGLPTLPFDSVYQIWVDDGREAVSGGTFLPDERGSVQRVVRAGSVTRPVRVTVSVAPTGGSPTIGRLIVLTGAVER